MRGFRLILILLAAFTFVTASAWAQDTSISFTKTVGTDPDVCADATVLPEVPEDGVVYYCYKITYTGAISASCHTLEDSVLGSVLDNIPGSRCCTDASATDCQEPIDKCSPNDTCSNPYPVCANVTFPGICCNDPDPSDEERGVDCPIPHEGCIDTSDCSSGYCATDILVSDGQTVTRVITATVPAEGVTNNATWSVQTGICCVDESFVCNGELVNFCQDNDDCFGSNTCRKQGVGLCCNPGNLASCDSDLVCLSGRTCEDPNDPNTPFTQCVGLDTADEQEAVARVGVFSTPAVSAVGLGLLVLGLAGVGLVRVKRLR